MSLRGSPSLSISISFIIALKATTSDKLSGDMFSQSVLCLIAWVVVQWMLLPKFGCVSMSADQQSPQLVNVALEIEDLLSKSILTNSSYLCKPPIDAEKKRNDWHLRGTSLGWCSLIFQTYALSILLFLTDDMLYLLQITFLLLKLECR